MSAALIGWLETLPGLELALIICGFLIAVTLIGIVLVHPLMRRLIHGRSPANDIVVYIAGSFGLIYAVLLGLLTVATFQTTKDVEDDVGREAASVAAIYRAAEGYPEPLRSDVRARLRDYTHYVIDKDWPAQARGRVLMGGEHRLQMIRRDLLSYEPTSRSQEVLQGETMRTLNALTVARQGRLGTVSAAIPAVLWYVVLAGALITIAFLWMLQIELLPQILFGAITALFLGMMIFLIFAMDHPLQGAVSVGPDAFQSTLDMVMQWDDTS
jgi:hypothetical protein